MNKIYCFSLFEAGYTSVHSLVRELFDSPKTICPSFSQGDLLYVLSKKPPVKPLHYRDQDSVVVNEKTKTIELETHVAFCNRHRENIIPKKLFPKEALEKFCSLSGLEKDGDKVECKFRGPHKENKFNIHNSFCIQGLFTVADHNKFNQVLKNGVGSRKSYGYGLILIKKGGEYESVD